MSKKSRREYYAGQVIETPHISDVLESIEARVKQCRLWATQFPNQAEIYNAQAIAIILCCFELRSAIQDHSVPMLRLLLDGKAFG